jgi:uncharacterized protein (TIGR02246 family)
MMDPEIRDELAIRRLVARYCHAVATQDDDAWANTWTEDGEWSVLGRSVSGRTQILDWYRKLVASFRFVVQRATDGLIDVDGDRATGRWIVSEYLQGRDGGPGLTVGIYEDAYQRDPDGVWRFARRHFEALYLGAPDLSGEPVARRS